MKGRCMYMNHLYYDMYYRWDNHEFLLHIHPRLNSCSIKNYEFHPWIVVSAPINGSTIDAIVIKSSTVNSCVTLHFIDRIIDVTPRVQIQQDVDYPDSPMTELLNGDGPLYIADYLILRIESDGKFQDHILRKQVRRRSGPGQVSPQRKAPAKLEQQKNSTFTKNTYVNIDYAICPVALPSYFIVFSIVI
ncbi:hypothetical protein M513_07471 [Trichuris suis]|uniref:Uncharacterized protein n=1 Tax=Trichuris suis TaxID=68888 RepID=A0A085M2Z6_9BILA|nr:hypothetical protein M513_07471 [Trichuris suis]